MRYFVDENGVHRKVPKGETPEEMGFDESKAEEIPRFPKDFERWHKGQMVMDHAGKAQHAEDARLRSMRPADRHAEAIAVAGEEIIAAMREGGMHVPDAVLTKLAARAKGKTGGI